MKTLKNLDQVYKLAGKHQVTAQELLNDRLYIDGKGWSEVKLTPEFRVNLVNNILDILGGRTNTRQQMERRLMFEKPQHWGLGRILLSNYNNKGARLSYCAGQDMTWELREIRNALK